MKYIVLSVYDRAAEAFGRPVFATAERAAIRSFRDEIARVDIDNAMNRHPGDFELMKLGEFDDSNGSFELSPRPQLIATGREMTDADTPQPVGVRRIG